MAFLWIGGRRPSMAFHLLYSKFGLQFEAIFDELIRGLRTHDLGDISASQLAQLDETQRRTILEEREVTDLMETHQESLVDAPMVELSHVVAEMIRANETGENKEIEDKVESTLCQWWKFLETAAHNVCNPCRSDMQNILETTYSFDFRMIAYDDALD
ncbi:hypothetical protein JHK87_012551 [Glycine soja]|nr:hypothetical protein JHK87_012551 [Glycine soja]